MTTVHAKLASLFALPGAYTITYLDDENEKITVLNDADLEEALSFSSDDGRKALRFQITQSTIRPDAEGAAEHAASLLRWTGGSVDSQLRFFHAAVDSVRLQCPDGDFGQLVRLVAAAWAQLGLAERARYEAAEAASDGLAARLHEGEACGGCGERPVAGVRYKCGVCEDFDETHDETHAFYEIKSRRAAPAARSAVSPASSPAF